MTKTFLFFIVILVSCGQSTSKFDPDVWQKFSDLGQNPEREKMLTDLTQNHKLKGLHYNDLVKKLGQPDFWETDPVVVYYGLITEYNGDIDPTGQRSLKFLFTKDSLVYDFAVVESGQ